MDLLRVNNFRVLTFTSGSVADFNRAIWSFRRRQLKRVYLIPPKRSGDFRLLVILRGYLSSTLFELSTTTTTGTTLLPDTIMADDKKTDGYAIEMDKLGQGNRTFEAPAPPPQPRGAPPAALSSNPILPVLAYCGSSILMTVMNKYVLSGTNFNLNFFLLCVQVCVEEEKGTW